MMEWWGRVSHGFEQWAARLDQSFLAAKQREKREPYLSHGVHKLRNYHLLRGKK